MIEYFINGASKLNISLSETVIKRELEFLDEMLRWNQKVNLTAITDRAEAIEKHLLDSLMLLDHLDPAEKILDMGSGGGFPGIPLAIADPEIKIISVDSVGKKVNFQKHVKRKLNLRNLTIQQSRVEILSQTDPQQKKYDVVLSRAFSSLNTFIEYAYPLLMPDGKIIAMKGPEGGVELQDIKMLQNNDCFEEPEILNYALPYSQAERVLIVLKNRC